MSKWYFMFDNTHNTSYSFELSGSVNKKVVALATRELDNDSFVGVYGYGDTEEEAQENAQNKILKLEENNVHLA